MSMGNYIISAQYKLDASGTNTEFDKVMAEYDSQILFRERLVGHEDKVISAIKVCSNNPLTVEGLRKRFPTAGIERVVEILGDVKSI